MPNILKPTITSPIEREYEAWLVRRIREYYKSIDVNVELFAVTPSIEVIFPADHMLYKKAKLVGLQFKQAKIAPSKSPSDDFKQLKWTFHEPAGQFALLSSFKDIYYVLPTFISRDYEDVSLHHCLFWRPSPNTSLVADHNAWYHNPGPVKTPYDSIKDSMRWGLFYEQLVDCEIGQKIDSKTELEAFMLELKEQSLRSAKERKTLVDPHDNLPSAVDSGGLYLLLMDRK